MTVDTDNIDVTNDEAILKDNQCVGYVTSGGYAHHVKKKYGTWLCTDKFFKT